MMSNVGVDSKTPVSISGGVEAKGIQLVAPTSIAFANLEEVRNEVRSSDCVSLSHAFALTPTICRRHGRSCRQCQRFSSIRPRREPPYRLPTEPDSRRRFTLRHIHPPFPGEPNQRSAFQYHRAIADYRLQWVR